MIKKVYINGDSIWIYIKELLMIKYQFFIENEWVNEWMNDLIKLSNLMSEDIYWLTDWLNIIVDKDTNPISQKR